MIKDLNECHSATCTIKEPKAFADSILYDFEDSMNNNLDVKGAFDKLYENLSRLHKIKEKLSREDAENILKNLQKADYVLQCIF